MCPTAAGRMLVETSSLLLAARGPQGAKLIATYVVEKGTRLGSLGVVEVSDRVTADRAAKLYPEHDVRGGARPPRPTSLPFSWWHG